MGLIVVWCGVSAAKDSAQHIGDWKRSKEINKISGSTVVRQLKGKPF